MSKKLLAALIAALFLFPIVAFAAEGESDAVSWTKLIIEIASVLIPVIIGFILLLPPVVKFFGVKSRKDGAIAIAILADGFVERYLQDHPGATWAVLLDKALDTFVEKLKKTGLSTNSETAERALAVAYKKANYVKPKRA